MGVQQSGIRVCTFATILHGAIVLAVILSRAPCTASYATEFKTKPEHSNMPPNTAQ